MADAVKMRMVVPFRFARPAKNPIREIWLASDSHVAIQ
jgi:hypothetical protein